MLLMVENRRLHEFTTWILNSKGNGGGKLAHDEMMKKKERKNPQLLYHYLIIIVIRRAETDACLVEHEPSSRREREG